MGKQNQNQEQEFKNRIYDIRKYASEKFDALVIYLSASALGLTVGFFDKIFPDKKALGYYPILISSWSLFSSSLIFMLLSLMTAINMADFELQDKQKKSDFWNMLTISLNNFSVVTLILGIIFFITFTSLNLSNK